MGLAQRCERLGLDLVTVREYPYQSRFLDTWTLLSCAVRLSSQPPNRVPFGCIVGAFNVVSDSSSMQCCRG